MCKLYLSSVSHCRNRTILPEMNRLLGSEPFEGSTKINWRGLEIDFQKKSDHSSASQIWVSCHLQFQHFGPWSFQGFSRLAPVFRVTMTLRHRCSGCGQRSARVPRVQRHSDGRWVDGKIISQNSGWKRWCFFCAQNHTTEWFVCNTWIKYLCLVEAIILISHPLWFNSKIFPQQKYFVSN